MGIRLGIGRLKVGQGGSPAVAPPFDADAEAYIAAEGIIDATAKAAITQLVIDLKAISASFVDFVTPASGNRKAIYLFPGNVAVSNTRNLLNPANSDAAYRLTYTGTPVFSANGVKGGTFDTKLNTLSVLALNNHEYGFAQSVHGYNTGVEFQLSSGTTCRLMQYSFDIWCNDGDVFNTNAVGYAVVLNRFLQTNRKAAAIGEIETSINNILNDDNGAVGGGTLPNVTMKIKPIDEISFVGIGVSISDVDNVKYFNAIERFNYGMHRLKLNNFMIEGHSFMAGSGTTSFPGKFVTSILLSTIDVYATMHLGTGGATMATLNARTATVNKYVKSKAVIPFKNNMILWIGVNDGFTGATYTSLKSYVQTRIVDGWDNFFVFTGTPFNGTAQDEINRVAFNASLRNDLSLITGVHVVDTDLIPELLDWSDLTYFSDGLHPTSAGYNFAISALIASIETYL